MPAKRVLISLEERLLGRIDDACARRNVSRSAYLAQLAEADLVAGIGPGADPTVRLALATIDGLVARAHR